MGIYRNKKQSRYENLRIILTIIVTAIITFIITILWVYGGKTNNSIGDSIVGKGISNDNISTKFEYIKQKINSEYMGEVDEKNLEEMAVKGYVYGLGDSYSVYYTPDEMKEIYTDTVGEFVGIGIYMTKDTEKNQIVVYSTISDSPAEEVGIKAGDIIIEVDGVACSGDDFDTLPNKIKGKSGSKVKVKVKRDNNEIEFNIERRKVLIKKVTSQIVEDDIGYIKIDSFDGNVSSEFKEAYDSVVKKGAKSLIIDLRNNGGGVVDEAVNITKMFTKKDDVLLVEVDKNNKKDISKATEDGIIKMNTILLVNEQSASASELLAGILKDNCENVKIVGKTTYGKGVIQSLYTLQDGSGLKITTQEYYTPKNEKINKIGIVPDIVVDDYSYTGVLDKENDTQYKKAIEELKK